MAAARIAEDLQDCLYLGNLDAKRDWGHARDYVEGMWRIMNHGTADDFVLATNKTTTVRDFLKMSFRFAGVDLEFHGSGVEEAAVCTKTGKVVVKVDPNYFRPTEVELLIGNAAKAEEHLNWKAHTSVEELCKEMVFADLKRVRDEKYSMNNHKKSVEALVHGENGFLNWYEQNYL